MLAIVDEENSAAIKNAYAEGYKAGILEYAPENARLESINRVLEKENQKYQEETRHQQKKAETYRMIAPAAVILGALAGLGAGGLIWKQ